MVGSVALPMRPKGSDGEDDPGMAMGVGANVVGAMGVGAIGGGVM